MMMISHFHVIIFYIRFPSFIHFINFNVNVNDGNFHANFLVNFNVININYLDLHDVNFHSDVN